jgi:predicted lipid carrier protein YhbT
MRVRPFVVPTLVGRMVGALPRTTPEWALSAALNLARGRLFAADAFDALRGRIVRLRALDAGLDLRLTLGARGFAPAPAGAPPDVTIAANTYDLLVLATRAEDSDSLFFNRRLQMQGDTELGLLIKNTLDGIDFAAPAPGRLAARMRPHRG